MLRLIVQTMRPRQWTKNLALLVGLVFDRQLTDPDSVMKTLAAVVIFCLMSGVTYIINDLMDIESDRQHPEKKHRPLASGSLSPKIAITAAILLGVLLFPAAFWLSINFGMVVAAYFLVMLVYSKWLKNIPLIDVLTIAAGFVLRVSAGVLVIKVAYFSPWLFLLTTLLALFLAFGKRQAELVLLEGQAVNYRKVLRGYTIALLDQLILIVLGATLITYSLYTFSATVTPDTHAMMFTIPFVMYGLMRYLYLLHIKNNGGTPEEVLLTDRPIQVAILLWGLAVWVILYLL